MSTRLFGTDGIRGVANEYPITPELALKLGRAVARVLRARHPGRQKVVIGKDTRLSGYMLETALTSGLVSEGARVLLTGPIPTPAIAHLTRSMACDAGIMLTASHNPYGDNGIKIFGADGYKLTDDLEEEIERFLLDNAQGGPPEGAELGKAMRVDDAVGRYIEAAKGAVGATSLDGLKVVVDCANGAGYFLAPLVFEELGAEVIPFAVKPDGRNINADCGAMHPGRAAALVRESGADVGICLDGDADRVIFIDAQGKIVSGDRILCLCAKALDRAGQLRHRTLVATVMSNLGLRDSLARDGISLETTGVGDRQVIERMRKNGYSLGGENSGHIIFADHATTGDGIVSALEVLSTMKKNSAALAELADCMEEYPQITYNLPVREKPPIHEVPALVDAIALVEDVLKDSGRTLVRYSGTERKIRILVECPDESEARRHADNLAKAVEASVGAGI
jgi:phosphoglucosamine mutase